MHIFSINPSGILTHIPLRDIIWRLELAAVGDSLGIGLRYVSSGTTSLALLCAIEIDGAGDTLDTIARKGLPRGTPAADVELLSESLKILHNAQDLKSKDVDQIIKDGAPLAEHYHRIRKAIENQLDDQEQFGKWQWRVRREW